MGGESKASLRETEKVKLIMAMEPKLPRLALTLLSNTQLDGMLFAMAKTPPDFSIRKVSTDPVELREKFKETYLMLRQQDAVPDIMKEWEDTGIEATMRNAYGDGFIDFEDLMAAKKNQVARHWD